MAGVGRIVALAVGLAAVAPRAPAEVDLRVLGDRVNLRAQPVADAEVVGQAMAGDRLTTPEPLESNEWVRVIAPASVDLWMYNELIRDGKVAVNRAQVRGGPGLQFKPVGQLDRDTPVEIRGVLGDWTRIGPTSACFLWINRQYVEPFDAVAAPAAAPVDEVAVAVEPETLPAKAPVLADSADAPSTTGVPPAIPVALPDEPAAVASAAAPPEPPAQSSMPLPVQTAPEPAYTPPPPLPSALRGYVADAHRIQHAPARYTGILTRSPPTEGPRACSFRLVADGTGRGRRDVRCYLLGFDGQLDGLVNTPVEVKGRIWHLAGLQTPVLDVRRLVARAPSD